MKKVVVSAKSVEEAIQQALEQLNTTQDKVQIEILEQPAKGFLGFGSRDAKIEVTKPSDPIEEAQAFLQGLAEAVDIPLQYEVETHKSDVTIQLHGEQVGFWIGRRGQMLDAVQYLMNIVANKTPGQHVRIGLDAEQFRSKRRDTLESLAEKLAERVVRTRKEVVLEPMTSQERKIIHFQLQEHPKVSTFSKGEEPNRRIVICLKENSRKER
jgi:spoIIIJ-associated protein